MFSRNNNNDDESLSPEAEQLKRKVSRYGSAAMGFNLFAFLFLLGVIVYKLFSYANSDDQTIRTDVKNAVQPVFDRSLDLPDGVEILNASQQGNQILLNLKFKSGDLALWIYDVTEDRIVGKLSIK